jgi:hypothetical protein
MPLCFDIRHQCALVLRFFAANNPNPFLVYPWYITCSAYNGLHIIHRVHVRKGRVDRPARLRRVYPPKVGLLVKPGLSYCADHKRMVSGARDYSPTADCELRRLQINQDVTTVDHADR